MAAQGLAANRASDGEKNRIV